MEVRGLAWLADHAEDEGLAGPVGLHGDSAGGNLALVGALRNPGRGQALALVYPFLDPTAGFDSYRTAADGFGIASRRHVPGGTLAALPWPGVAVHPPVFLSCGI